MEWARRNHAGPIRALHCLGSECIDQHEIIVHVHISNSLVGPARGPSRALPTHPLAEKSSPSSRSSAIRVTKAKKRALCFQRIAHSLSRAKTPTIVLSKSSALFDTLRKCNHRIFSYFRSLCSLFCKSSILNSFAFNCVHALFCKGRGAGKIRPEC
jgi:hypothetical protein